MKYRVARFCHKSFGLTLYDIEYNTTLEKFLQYMELMEIDEDFHIAQHKDHEARMKENK